MRESHQDEWEEVLARRLITQAENHPSEEQKKDDTRPDRGGEEAVFSTPASASETPAEQSSKDMIETDPESEVPTTRATFAKVEKSLISLGFFTPSSKRIKNQKVKRITFTRTLDGKKVEATAEFHPSAVFGLPITADQDKFLALNDIITNILQKEGKVSNPIRFTSAQLLRLLNSRVRAGKNYRDISEWLDVMTSTTIISNGVVWKEGEKRFARDRFHVFQRAVSVGRELPDGTIADANYVWLSDWQLENINHNFLLPIDLQTYRELKNHISKALVPLLQIWLFASQRAGSFEKRYDELCEMLSLQVYKAPSLITRQLKPSLDELVRYEYLNEWRIEKTSDRKAYKIILFHGAKFHRDRRRRLDQKQQSESTIVVAQSEPVEPELPLPGRLEPAPPPPEKKTTKPKTATAAAPKVAESSQLPPLTPSAGESQDLLSHLVDELSLRGIMPSAATRILQSLPPESLLDVEDYIAFWDLKRTTSDVREGWLITLITERHPLPANFETRRKGEERQADENRRQKLWTLKESLTAAYESYRRTTLERFVTDVLGREEFERRVAAHLKQTAGQQGLWTWNSPEVAEQMARHSVRTQIQEQVAFLSYEAFRQRELPRILAELNLNPAELGIDLTKIETPASTMNQNAPDGSIHNV